MHNIKLKTVSKNTAYIFRVYAVQEVTDHLCVYKETPGSTNTDAGRAQLEL
jgi:hypothetical protein